MRKLNKNKGDTSDFEWHKKVVQSKKNPRRSKLQSKSSNIDNAIRSFGDAINTNSIETILADSTLTEIKEDLHHCYLNETATLRDLKKSLESSQKAGLLKWCPFCGITTPSDFDHYLPKEKYPEFSVTALNLVKCCRSCNSSKGAKFLDDSNERMFLHFYSDDIPVARFLNVNLVSLGGALTATYSLTRPDSVQDNMWKLIENHYSQLGLLEKFKNSTNDDITEVTNICVAHMRDNGDSLSNFLSLLTDGEEEIFGVNYWRAVLKRALANSEDFLLIVESEI